MTRSGIYVNGKEIVARYVGDKKVWEKTRIVLLAEFNDSIVWGDPDTRILSFEGIITDDMPAGTYRNVTVYIDDEQFITPIYKVVISSYEHKIEFHFLSSYIANRFSSKFNADSFSNVRKRVRLFYKP